MLHECSAAGQADCAQTSLRRARAVRPVAGQCGGPERARRGYKPLDGSGLFGREPEFALTSALKNWGPAISGNP